MVGRPLKRPTLPYSRRDSERVRARHARVFEFADEDIAASPSKDRKVPRRERGERGALGRVVRGASASSHMAKNSRQRIFHDNNIKLFTHVRIIQILLKIYSVVQYSTSGGITGASWHGATHTGTAHAVVSCHPGITNPGVYAGGTNSPGITVPCFAGTITGRIADMNRGALPGVQNPGV